MVAGFLLFSAFPILAATNDRIVVRDSVSKSHREELLRNLRTITGWAELTFASDGALRIGDASPRNGSQSARDLIRRAVSGNRVILFEDASSRKDVIFCSVVLGKLLREPPENADVYIVLIDFADFRQVSGDKEARAAFDVGWAVLHEIDHVVEDSQDPEQDTSAGDCEAHVNKMRRELGLPVRNSYFFSFLPLKNDGNFVSRFVRLGFDRDNGASSKRKRYWLVWDAAVVGGLSEDSTAVTTIATTDIRSSSCLSPRAF
jgi:hypothetical protein